jgi:SAM-dependent MidA family methyltransferase
MSLQKRLKAGIAAQGPLDIGRFMSLSLEQYYGTRDPFGAAGHFTTAPEISQMFGEMIGAWSAQVWIDMGRPERLTLLECGPGRGTLMADVLRATRGLAGFHAALDIRLLEMSPVLRGKQAEMLKGFSPVWLDDLAALPDSPVILLANEFLDALPVRHIEFSGGQWQERAVGLEKGTLTFTHIPAPPELLALIPPILPAPKEGDILELSPDRAAFMETVFALLKSNTGAALFLDYGYARPAYGETLQALYKHEFCPVLEHVGEADITAHVDFSAIQRAAGDAGVQVFGPAGQGDFLKALGIEARCAMLMKTASPSQAEVLRKALHRLTHSDEMGTLFKVMGLTYGLERGIAGFAP